MKKVIFNFSNLENGGGGQISQWFIHKLLEDNLEFEPVFFVSKVLNDRISFKETDKVYIFHKSPVRSLIERRKAIDISERLSASLVFTLFGPSGVNFKCAEVSGVANAWIASVSFKDFISYFGALSPLYIFKYYMHGRSLSKKDYLIFETKKSRNDFISRFKYNQASTEIIPNTFNDYFLDYDFSQRVVKDFISLTYVSSYYPHKNFEMIPQYLIVLSELEKEIGSSFIINLTLKSVEFEKLKAKAKENNLDHMLNNLGYISPCELPYTYAEADIVFSASSIENFSAIYPESIVSSKPLIVADRLFSREVCEEYAYYYEPMDAKSFKCAVYDVIKNNFKGNGEPPELISPNNKFRLMIDCISKNLK